MSQNGIQFTDRNFKLAVINQLMYSENLIQPEFDVWEFAENYKARKIDVDDEGYEVIPEVMDYFMSIEVTPEMAEQITEIYQDGGDEVYMNIIPFWDGEDDEFNITSAEDAKHFPNLKKITLFYDKDESILDKFKALGIKAKWL